MSQKPASEPYSKLFRSAGTILPSESPSKGLDLRDEKSKLSLPPSQEVAPEEMQEAWKNFRKFFLTGKGGSVPATYRSIHMDPSLLSHNQLAYYPLLLIRATDKSIFALPLRQWLDQTIEDQLPEKEDGLIIKKTKNILFGEILKQADIYKDEFNKIWSDSVHSYIQQMDLKGSEQKTFKDSFERLEQNLPEYGKLVQYSPHIVFPVLDAALSDKNIKRKVRLAEKIDAILPALTQLLEVERENDPDSIAPDHLKASLSFAGHHFDFEKLSKVLPESSSEHLTDSRQRRINQVIYSLEKGKSLLNHRGTLFIQEDLIPNLDWEQMFPGFEVNIVPKGELCSSTSEYFEAHITDFSDVIKSLRIGLLEKDNKYNADLHDQLFDSFQWRFIQEEELDLVAPLILIADSKTLAREEIAMMSRILSSDMPIKIIGLTFDNKKAPDTLLDPASLSIAHRNTFVSRLSCLNPMYMFDRIKEGLSTFSPSFIQIRTVKEHSGHAGFIELNGSLEGREFPVFTYNGQVGTPWGSRFDVSENPAVEDKWPSFEYSFTNNESEELIKSSFTYGDYLFLKNENKGLFLEVPVKYWTEDLIPLATYLGLKGEARYGKLPYLLAVDAESQIQRVLVCWKVVTNCLEVLDYWQYLQDCGGVNSYHVQEALNKQEKRLREELENEISRLKEDHKIQLEEVKKESTEEAMDHLTSALLDMDSESLISHSSKELTKDESVATQKLNSEEEEIESEPIKEAPENKEQAISEDPWIETALCTNCNECTDINNRMFKYNENKLAYIADPKAGTYAQLVEAAEKCPVHIIHPGMPLNSSEEGLDELIKRAEKYN